MRPEGDKSGSSDLSRPIHPEVLERRLGQHSVCRASELVTDCGSRTKFIRRALGVNFFGFRMKSLLAVLLLGVVAAVSADQCPHTCSRTEVYYVRCGWFGLWRCARYRTVNYVCLQYCLHGDWSPYVVTSETACSVTCGGGTKMVTSQRTCTNPAPYNGGDDCAGESQKTEMHVCNTQHCPIDGGWSDFGAWEDYDECSALCGGGSKDQWRARTCDNPAPAYGGKYCVGVHKQNQTVTCNTEECGDKCPDDQPTYIANDNSPNRYYQCDNGVARLQECQTNTKWDQETLTCVHTQDQAALHQGADCDPAVVLNVHPTDCTKYFMCLAGHAYEMSCPATTRFNPDLPGCDHEDNVPCSSA